MPKTPFGPGTITLTVDSTPLDFAAEVKGGGVTHAYTEAGDPTTYLDGSAEAAGASRGDGLEFEIDNDLTTVGLYAFLDAHDLEDATFVYTPNTAAAASWSGTVQLRMPDGVKGENYGAKIAGTVKWSGVGKFTFTPGT